MRHNQSDQLEKLSNKLSMSMCVHSSASVVMVHSHLGGVGLVVRLTLGSGV